MSPFPVFLTAHGLFLQQCLSTAEKCSTSAGRFSRQRFYFWLSSLQSVWMGAKGETRSLSWIRFKSHSILPAQRNVRLVCVVIFKTPPWLSQGGNGLSLYLRSFKSRGQSIRLSFKTLVSTKHTHTHQRGSGEGGGSKDTRGHANNIVMQMMQGSAAEKYLGGTNLTQ